ncbi:unnamed protein product [Vicia faba]|uniref:Anther-specific protein BCP1 n=1 Tax=Vicia faba TaxID=3906 RepID=A0AAV1BBZ2_VICFA|nr:unnamed protein product [Vicia faba]
MARSRHVVVLALIMLAMIGLSCAADPPMPSEDDYEEDDSEFLIGTRRGDPPSANGGVIAAPIGGPVPPGAFDTPPAKNAASSIQFSAVGTAVATAVAGIFYF